MTTLWRLQTKTNINPELSNIHDISEYCLDEKIIAIGWSMADHQIQDMDQNSIKAIKEEREKIKNYEMYEELTKKYGKWHVGAENASRLRETVENDLIWMRCRGIYYLGRITKDSAYRYNRSKCAQDRDAANQLTDIDWIKIGDESTIPGAIRTSFIKGRVFQRIRHSGMLEYSELLYKFKHRENMDKIYEDIMIKNNCVNFFNFLSTEDSEDLLCMWLYHKEKYICIPSTSKQSTELYEGVLLNPKTGKHVYTQVKKGKIDLYVENYQHLDGEVWLLTTQGIILGDETDCIKKVDPNALYEFAMSDDTCIRKILPDSIKTWVTILKNVNVMNGVI